MAKLEVLEVDLSRADAAEAVVALLDAYSRDPMGNGAPLPAEVKRNVVPGLRAHPTTLVFVAYLDGMPVGLAVCFGGFSTFAARPLINVHDLAVLPEHRGQGVARRLLEAVAEKGRALGCCKLTLEVLDKNSKALRLYSAAGFHQAVYRAEAGAAIFMVKPL